jgi:hypothetical protein
MAEEVKAFRWLLEDPASAKEEWLGKNIDGLAACDIFNCVMKWSEWFHRRSAKAWCRWASRVVAVATRGATTWFARMFSPCTFRRAASVLFRCSTVPSASRPVPGVGRPQHGADQYGAQSAHVRGRGGRGGRGRSGARATKSPKTRTKRGQL